MACVSVVVLTGPTRVDEGLLDTRGAPGTSNPEHSHVPEPSHEAPPSDAGIPEDAPPSDAGVPEDAPSSSELGDWNQVSPSTTFLAEHLPPTLPSRAHEARMSILPLSARIMHEYDAGTSPAHAGPSPGHITRSVQAPDCVVCPAHGPVLRVCPTHGLTTVIRRGPLESANDLTHGVTSEAASIADTLSVINSFTMSLSPASSPARSTYATPERALSPLPNVGQAPTPALVNVASQGPAPPLVNVASRPSAPALVNVASRPSALTLVNVASQPTPAFVNARPQAPAPSTNAHYVPYITDNNDSDNYYIVTRGRTVGVFDNSYVCSSLRSFRARWLTCLTQGNDGCVGVAPQGRYRARRVPHPGFRYCRFPIGGAARHRGAKDRLDA